MDCQMIQCLYTTITSNAMYLSWSLVTAMWAPLAPRVTATTATPRFKNLSERARTHHNSDFQHTYVISRARIHALSNQCILRDGIQVRYVNQRCQEDAVKLTCMYESQSQNVTIYMNINMAAYHCAAAGVSLWMPEIAAASSSLACNTSDTVSA